MAAWNFAVLVDAIARENPAREAVVHGSRRATWGQFAARARSLAWYLHGDTGLAPGGRVAIVLPNSPEYLETFVAARKLLCVPLNIGVGAPDDTLHRMIDASDAKVVVCSAGSADAVHAVVRRIPKRWRPAVIVVGEQYDDGIATAIPPADWEVEVPTADDLVFLAGRDTTSAGADAGPTLLPAASLAYGNGLATALGALSRKGRVVFVASTAFDPALTWATVEQEQVTTMTIGGDPFARRLLAALPASPADALTTLRTLVSSGAALSPDVVDALEAALPDITIVDAFDGPAERAAAPRGAIRPSDVEARLRKHASVADCVVIGVSDPRVGKLVVALVEVTDGHYLDASELGAWCRAHLPSTLTPARFVFLDTLSRTPTGAADYDALRLLALERLLGEP